MNSPTPLEPAQPGGALPVDPRPRSTASATRGGEQLSSERPGDGGSSLPLTNLLEHCAAAVRAVRSGVSLNEALLRCPAPLRPGTQALSFHALRWLGAALTVRALLVRRAPPPEVDALLLCAITLLWPDAPARYAEHTLVDQAVGAARRIAPHSAAFVNATLRRFLRERTSVRAAALRDPQALHNHPAWWIDRLAHDWPREAPAILHAANEHPPMDLRVNARRSSPENYLARLAENGIAAHRGAGAWITLSQPCPVTRLPGFEQGDVSVQDAAAQLAAPLLLGSGLLPGARVLDACAAPGGKTAHLLELADLDLTALDRDAARLQRVEQTLRRLGLHAKTMHADAGDPSSWWDGRPFDAVLLDAPCSASGIVRRHPDIRWLRRSRDIDALAAIQAELLEALWPLLKPGGRLVYATCSVFKNEGQTQVDVFLQRHSEAKLAQCPPATGHLLPLPENQGIRTDPAAYDGFFYALLVKT